MTDSQKDDSGFVFGIIIGAIIGAVVAIVIHQQDKDEVIKQLKTKIEQVFNPHPSPRRKIKTNQPKPRPIKKPKKFIIAKK